MGLQAYEKIQEVISKTLKEDIETFMKVTEAARKFEVPANDLLRLAAQGEFNLFVWSERARLLPVPSGMTSEEIDNFYEIEERKSESFYKFGYDPLVTCSRCEAGKIMVPGFEVCPPLVVMAYYSGNKRYDYGKNIVVSYQVDSLFVRKADVEAILDPAKANNYPPLLSLAFNCWQELFGREVTPPEDRITMKQMCEKWVGLCGKKLQEKEKEAIAITASPNPRKKINTTTYGLSGVNDSNHPYYSEDLELAVNSLCEVREKYGSSYNPGELANYLEPIRAKNKKQAARIMLLLTRP